MSSTPADIPAWGDGPEPIAIVGIGCRFPGESFTPSKLWDLLNEGKSANSELPSNRFDLEKWYHPGKDRPGSIPTRGGYFLSHDESFRQFDPSFFGINPLEAATMDPQQRKLLEVVYESFENAGATLDGLSGSKTSCYVGCFTHDVANMNSREAEYGAPYQMTGSDMTVLSNRINYVFNLKGASATFDTACSSSLYALHMACQSLLSGDADAAVVGGTNLILGVEQQIATARLGVLSPTSMCHTFDKAADGFGRGEGICAIYCKKLSKALSDNDSIRAVVRSTAINTNGRSQGINHPSVEGQEAVIRAAYAKAGLSYDETGYFECHGTGTPVGDPIEVAAIANVFASGRTSSQPLLLGSIKTNIGHTEGASGLASIVKAVLSIENNSIPPTVGISSLNPAIDFKGGRLAVVQSSSPWPAGVLKRASVNSFGYGGANAHCILESPEILLGQAPVPLASAVPAVDVLDAPQESGEEHGLVAEKYLLVFSAHDRSTVENNVMALANVANGHSATDIAHTLAYRRTRHRSYGFAVVSSVDIGSQLLSGGVTYLSPTNTEKPVIAFTFTGQGAQWPQMGLALVRQYPIVRETIDRLQRALDALPTPPTWRILDELSKQVQDSLVQKAALSQPLCTAIQIATTVLLTSWGIQPKAVVGHSSGEVAAAFASGLLEAEEAIAVAYYRGISVAARHTPGAMMAVGLGAPEVAQYLENQPDIVIGCQNSPQSVTLSGGEVAIDEVREALTKDGVFARKLNTSNNAYHSHLVKEAGQYYQDCFENSLPQLMHATRSSTAPMYSCITGEELRGQEDVGIEYWRRNLESPVLFTQALSSLIQAQPTVNCLIEIGPHSALSGPIRQIRSSLGIPAEDLSYIPSLVRGEDGVENVLKLAGSLYASGYPIDMSAINGRTGKFLPNLPTYQWNYDISIPLSENRLSRELRYRKHPRHDLLGSRQLGNSYFSPEWRNRLQIKNVPWISDHLVGEDVIFPAAGYVAMAIEAATQVAEIQGVVVQGYSFQRLYIKAPLILPPEGEVETLFNLRLLDDSFSQEGKLWFDFSISSVSAEDKWTEHADGKIALASTNESSPITELEVKGHRGAENRDSSDRRWYSALSNIGLHYGASFRPLKDIRTTAQSDDAMSYINLQPTANIMVQESRYMIHPATLDGCLQLAVIAAHNGDVTEIVKAYLPTVIDDLTVWQTDDASALPTDGILRSHGVRKGMRSAHGTSDLYTTDGRQLAHVAISLFSLEGGFGNTTSKKPRQPYTRLVWQPDIDRLHGDPIRELYPSGASDNFWVELSGHLDELGELVTLEAYRSLPDIVLPDSTSPHIFKYVDFIAQKGKSLSETSPLSQLSPLALQQRKRELVAKCGDHVPEADLIAHMSSRMPSILQGEVGALDVMLEDGRLAKMYDQGFSHLAAYPQLARIFKLIAHKEPRLKILEIGAGTGGATKPVLAALQANSLSPRYVQYTFTDITTAFLGAAQERFENVKNMQFCALDIEQDPLSQGFAAATYDIVLASNVIHATKSITDTLKRCRSLLKPDGRIVIVETTRERTPITYLLGPLPGFWQGEQDGRVNTPFLSTHGWNTRLLEAGFSGTSILLDDYADDISSNSIVVSNVAQVAQKETGSTEKLWLIYRNVPHPLVLDVQSRAKESGIETEIVPLIALKLHIAKSDRVLMLAELEGSLLSNMSPEEMDGVKTLFKSASSAVWVTNGGLLKGKIPEHSLIFGIAKSIMTEQPSIRISSIDLDIGDISNPSSADLIVQHEQALRKDHDRILDTELIQADGVTYISRYIVDPIENKDFARQLKPIPEILQLRDGLELAFQDVGQVGSFYFREKPSAVASLQDDEILLAPTVYNLSKREAGVLKGLQEADGFSNVCVAIVKDVACGATKFNIGQRVICFSPGNFDSSFVSQETSCEALRAEDDSAMMVSSLLPYCSAFHALSNLARVQRGQTVLIHRISGSDGMAAVRLALLFGAKVIATFDSVEKQISFSRRHPELADCHMTTAGSAFSKKLISATNEQLVDVAIVSPAAPEVPEVWASLARDGKLICTGDKEPLKFSLLDPSVFARGASLSSFDLLDMIKVQPKEVGKLARKVLILLRDDALPTIAPEASYDLLELPEAIATATRPETTSSVVLKYADGGVAPIHDPYKPVELSHSASYLLIGCLGGLGRSLVTWMLARGARHFLFLSRSGADKPEAARLVRELEEMAAISKEHMTITIVRGDVSSRADVDRAISLAKTPIRGVMQQAMFLKDGLFDDMDLQTWQSVLDPKVQGTINLHEALKDEPLDFFVMTSSVLGAIGASTQSNYAAANAFLDHMARHRCSMGLQACSIALGMIVEVGHVEAHPEVEQALRRNGVYGIPEDEYLKMMEVACRRRDPTRVSWDWDSWAQSHIVTGMEPGKVTKAGGKSLWLQDNRVRNLVTAITGADDDTALLGSEAKKQTTAALRSAAEAGGEAAVFEALQNLVLQRLSKLVLVPTEKLIPSLARPLAEIGMDSMITAELRTWAWRELRADIPFMALLEGGMSISGLVNLVWEKMDPAVWKD